jgi:hypothetical protein
VVVELAQNLLFEQHTDSKLEEVKAVVAQVSVSHSKFLIP